MKKLLLLGVASFLAGRYLTAAQAGYVSEQVVFHVDHEAGNGAYVVEPREVRIAYTIMPTDGSHPAPLSADSLMVCRQYNEGSKLYLRCGMDRYEVKGLGLIKKN